MTEKVFDLLNCGPRRRFVVRGADKKPIIVSNCFANAVSATARDVFLEDLLRLADAGFYVVLDIYDEVVVEADLDVPVQTVVDLMSVNPSWAKTLPIGAEGEESFFYKK